MSSNSKRWQKPWGKKKKRDGEADVENGDEEDDGRQIYSERHPGSFNLEALKASEEFQRRVESNLSNPKRKVALCFGYLGTKYQGLQINPDALTIESTLEKALFLARGIHEHNFGFLQKIQWTRAARTDRGVHAVAQCCGMRLNLSLNDREAFMDQVNSFLPPDIRVFAVSKVCKNFNSKLMCTKRRYNYILPTYLLQDAGDINAIIQASLKSNTQESNDQLDGAQNQASCDASLPATSTSPLAMTLDSQTLKKIYLELKTYRASTEKIKALKDSLKEYEGTHLYHNFTTGKSDDDANANRYILSFECGETNVDPQTGVEWVTLSVLGQSFLLNQIRKMVGFAIDVVRGTATLENLRESLQKGSKIDVSMAPGLGLYLDELFFDNYNLKYGVGGVIDQQLQKSKKRKLEEKGGDGKTEDQPTGNDDDNVLENERLDWYNQTNVREKLDSFRNRIVQHVQEVDSTDMAFVQYLNTLRVQASAKDNVTLAPPPVVIPNST